MAYSYDYTGVGDPSTVRRSDGVEFPQDPGNVLYQEWQVFIAGGGTTGAAPSVTLSEYKENAKLTVNQMAAQARRELTTADSIDDDLGKALRFREAEDHERDSGSGTYLLLAAEVPQNGANVDEVHDAVLAELAALKTDLAAVEVTRREAHDDVDAAADEAAVDAILAALDFG